MDNDTKGSDIYFPKTILNEVILIAYEEIDKQRSAIGSNRFHKQIISICLHQMST